MASDYLGTYDPLEVTLNVGTLAVTGFADGEFITCARVDPDLYKNHTGAYGETSRAKNNNKTGTIVFTLKSTSPSNAKLDLMKLNPVTMPIIVKNNSTRKHIAVCTEGWINKEPNKVYGAEETMIEWEIFCSDLIMSHLE